MKNWLYAQWLAVSAANYTANLPVSQGLLFKLLCVCQTASHQVLIVITDNAW